MVWVQLNQEGDVMIEKLMNVAITPCYGNANKDSRRGKLNIPKKVLDDLGITEENNKVIFSSSDCNNNLILMISSLISNIFSL